MSGILGLISALLLPLLVGHGWLQWLWRDAHPAARLGYSYLLGVLITIVLILGWNGAGLSLQFPPLAVMLLVLGAIPYLFSRRQNTPASRYSPAKEQLVTWQRALWWLLAALLAVRFGGLLIEIVLRPLYPWDAWMNWAPKARVWLESGELVPFVHYSEWAQKSLETGVYTLGNPEASTYPPLVPLVQLWTALGLGEWRDNWINLPWMLCALSLLLAIYGQLRMARMQPLPAMLVIWLLFTMPYLNTHVALAGYADLWMAAFYAAAVMALINWSLYGDRSQLFLALIMAGACVMTKRPGVVWALILLPGFLIALVPLRGRWMLVMLGLGAVLLLIINGGVELQPPWGGKPIIISDTLLQIPGLGRYPIEFHPVSEYLIENNMLRNNWHLTGWLLLVLLPIVLWRVLRDAHLLPGLLVIFGGVLFMVVVFFYSSYYRSAADSTTLNRATFHLLPAMVYLWSLSLVMHRPRADKKATVSEKPLP